MHLEDLIWVGYEVPTAQATWVCTKSRTQAIADKPDGIGYFLEFSATNKRSVEVPETRTLTLRTSVSLAGTDPVFLNLVVAGQMIETDPWNRFMEVYKKD